MTRQVPDYLDFQGKTWVLCCHPLAAYKPGFNFLVSSTAYRRGYKARWLIEEGCLYLVSIRGVLENCTSNSSASSDHSELLTPELSASKVEASVGAMFPGSGGKAFAEWFTGDLVCNYGLVLKRWDAVSEAANICENKILIRVMRGHVMSIGTVKFVSELRRLFNRLRAKEADCRGPYPENRFYKKGDRGLGELLERVRKNTRGIAKLKEVEDKIKFMGPR